LDVDQISVINFEYRLAFCALPAHLEQVAALVLLLLSSLLEKAQKQQDLVVMSYDSKGTTKVLYEPKTSYKIDRIEVIVDENNRFIWQNFLHDQQN
jgi:hypothetical protein